MATHDAERSDDAWPAAFEVSPDPILVYDPAAGRIVGANDPAADLLGTSRADLRGRPTDGFDATAAQGTPTPRAVGTAVERGETTYDWELRSGDGDYRIASVTLRRSDAGDRPLVFAFVADVVERELPDESAGTRRAFARLHEVSMSDATPAEKVDRMLALGCEYLDQDVAYVTRIADGQQRVEYARGDHPTLRPDGTAPLSETYCQRTVESDDRVCAIPDVSAAGMDDDEAYERFGLESYLGRTVRVDGETYGTVCFADTRPRDRPFSESERTFVEVVSGWIGAVVEDERRRAELATRRRHLRAVFDAPSSFIGLLDPDGTLIRANSTAWSLVADDRENHLGEKFWTAPWWAHDADLQERVRTAVERVRNGETVEFEATHPTPDGDTLVADVTFRPILGDDGAVETIVAQGIDVTEHRERERRLQEQKRRIDTLLDNAPILLFAFDTDGVLTHSRGSALERIGLEEGQAVGENVFEMYDDETVRENCRRAIAGEDVSYEADVGGAAFRTWFHPVLDEDGEVRQVIGASVDVTEKRRQERRIEAVNDATRQLMYDETPAEVAETVVAIAERSLEKEMTAMWRYDEESERLEPVAASAAAREAAVGDGALSSIGAGTTEMAVFESGERTLVEDYGSLSNPGVPNSPLGSVLFVPVGDFGLFAVGSREVADVAPIEVTLVEILLRNAEAALDRARREQELEAYKRELEQSNRNLQEFAYIASHDLQEPLRMVSSYVDLLAMEYGDELDDEADEYIEFAVDGAERMQSMIDALLEYSRVHTHGDDFQSVDVEDVLADVLRSLELLVDERDADVHVASLPTVSADRDQIGQLFQNLVENAIQHGGESPTVTVSSVAGEDEYRFEVADDGPGVPADQRDRIFEIFKQGGHDDGGTGIGLAVCERIVHRHGGDIWIEPTDGSGATFCFTLPDRTDDATTGDE